MTRYVLRLAGRLTVLVCLLVGSPLRAGVLSGDGMGAYGDSLSWQYSLWVPLSTSFGYPLFSNGKQFNWVDHLVMSGYNFGPKINNFNQYVSAVGGATGAGLADQVTNQLPHLSSGAVKLSVLEIGGNEFTLGEYASIYGKAANASYNPLSDPAVQTLITTVVGNISAGIDATLAASPTQRMILMTVPDLGSLPLMRSQYPNASRRADVTAVVDVINQQLLELANQHQFPVVDLNAFAALSLTPPKIAGVQMLAGGGNGEGNRMYLSDGFHPGTVANGLLANAVLLANQLGYGDPAQFVSDQTIATRAGLTPTVGGPTYFDMSPYVILPVPEPASLVLATIAAVAVVGIHRRRPARSR